MATEADKTNTAVIVTMFAIGAAAMLGGSAAIVGMTRSEVQNFGEETEAFADLNAIREMRKEQNKLLTEAKVPISKAEAMVLKQIKQNPNAASPFTPPPKPKAAGDAGAANPEAESDETESEEAAGSPSSSESEASGATPAKTVKDKPAKGIPVRGALPTQTKKD